MEFNTELSVHFMCASGMCQMLNTAKCADSSPIIPINITVMQDMKLPSFIWEYQTNYQLWVSNNELLLAKLLVFKELNLVV